MENYKRLIFKRLVDPYNNDCEEAENATVASNVIEELDIIKDGMIFIFYKMCLEQNLGQRIFLKYKSKINEWFKSYLKTKDCRKKGNEKYKILF